MDTSADSPDGSAWSRTADWFRATPLELAGLAVLLTGALAASWALWWSASQRPSEPSTAVLEVGVDADGSADDEEQRVPTGHEDPGGAEQTTTSADQEEVPSEVTVHVTGAVAAPGLVTLPGGARVGVAVDAAGGLTVDAAPEVINLARIVADGEHVHVPRVGEEPPPPAPPESGPEDAAGTAPDGRVDINRASARELEALPGIGPARADAIVRHREAAGPFSVPGDLREVSGIGEATFQQLADLITVG